MLDNLNEKQQEAVKETEGAVLVLAGAGSGKTKVLTTRVAYLINEKGVNPRNILAITFTNKAATEMKERISKMVENSNKIQISTYHSLGLLFIRENCEKLNYQSNFTILDSEDVLTLIKKIMKEKGIDDKAFNPRAIRNAISSAKNELIDAKSYEKYALTEFEKKVYEVYLNYEKRLKLGNSLDFDDLLMLPIILFKNNPDILSKYQDRFEYILIDEYQDTNYAQYMLSKLLSAKYKNIFVVGDIDQSIYAFRGANYKNILNFEKDYPNNKTILLEENYRSTKCILNVANDIIKNNKQRKEKNLWTQNNDGEKITYHKAENEKDEANYVKNEIQKLIDNGVEKSNIAVLYRTNAQSRIIEEELLHHNIPYKVVGSFYFYNRKEIKDLISYLKLIYNPHDDISLLRIINTPKRGIGLKTIENLTLKAISENKSIYEAIDSGKELQFKNIIEKIKQKQEELSLTELIDYILNETGLKQELENEKTIEAEIRLENLNEFKTVARNFEDKYGIISLDEFLDSISLVSDIEEHKDNKDVITLMTIHSAKGLEFDYVFLMGMEETLFPHRNSLLDSEQIEEERRLCYVAVTRAKKKLYLTNARKRMIFGDISYNPPSRFINEINEEYLEKEETNVPKTFDKKQVINKNEEYQIGEKICHDKYGEGIIISMDSKILTVAFPHPHGIQKLIKGHISIRKVD
ncbi:MAG: UvrD-helicase domain-containing protein [Tenericutes bacterium]|nr:UvrD-helicase domain-containing protein [Mycoplasmatota bacterium]